MSGGEAQAVAGRQRLVVFVGGFDPRGARHYHRLFAQHAALQGDVDGCSYAVGPRQSLDVGEGQGAHRHARWMFDGPQGGGEYVFFDWSDEVRAHWPLALWKVAARAGVTYAQVLKDWSKLRPVRAQVPNTLYAFAYPLIYMCLALALALGGAALAWFWTHGVPALLHWLLPVAVAGGVLWGALALDRVLHVSWLLRIFNFAHASSDAHSSVLAARTEAMARWIEGEAARRPGLEVVVLGFSVGSVQALHLVDALRTRLPATARASDAHPVGLTLVTLGNCIPLFTLMARAEALRATLLRVAADSRVYWADISSPGDSVSFGMCDLVPLAMRGTLISGEVRHNPRQMCSPRFHKLFDASRYRLMRRNKMRMHFQYLMASQKPGAYNFFAMLTVRGAVRDFVEKFLVR